MKINYFLSYLLTYFTQNFEKYHINRYLNYIFGKCLGDQGEN